MIEKKPFVIMVASQKGGVGKTTIAINLAIALTYQDYKVLLIDSDTATFSVGEHLGIKGSGDGFIEAVNGKAPIEDTLFAYQPLNLHLILGTESYEHPQPSAENLMKFYGQVVKLSYDFVVVDSPPGFFNGSISRYLNDVIIVSTPDPPSASSSAKLSNYCEKLRLTHRLVINRSGYSKFELTKEEVERTFGDVAYMGIPEDKTVEEGLAKRKPVYMLDRGSPFSIAIEQLSRVYMLKVGEPVENRAEENKSSKRKGFFGRFVRWTAKSEE